MLQGLLQGKAGFYKARYRVELGATRLAAGKAGCYKACYRVRLGACKACYKAKLAAIRLAAEPN